MSGVTWPPRSLKLASNFDDLVPDCLRGTSNERAKANSEDKSRILHATIGLLKAQFPRKGPDILVIRFSARFSYFNQIRSEGAGKKRFFQQQN